MIDAKNLDRRETRRPPLTLSWITLSICGLLAGFLMVYFRERTSFHAGLSHLNQPTTIDRFTRIVTHPVTFFVEIVWLGAAVARTARRWLLVVSSAVFGVFLGGVALRFMR